MLKTLRLSLTLKNTYRVNGILYAIKQIPLIKNVLPDSIYSEVKRFYAAQDANFPLGKTALFQQLAIEGLIEADKGQNTKTKRMGDKRPRFLWLRVEALENKEDTE